MTPERYLQFLENFRMTQEQEAKFFGINERTCSRRVNKKAPISETTAKLLYVMEEFKLSPDQVDEIARRRAKR